MKPKRLILNLLLAADAQTMSARDVIGACRLFGVSENSARVTLARLATDSLIESSGRGEYRLGPAAVRFAADITSWRSAESRLRPWAGDWIAVHCGGLGRTDRAALRRRQRALQMNGFRELDKELFLRPANVQGGVDATRLRLHGLGLEPEAAVFRLTDLDAGRNQAVPALWEIPALHAAYLATDAQLHQWLARRHALEPDAAAREAFVLGDAAIRQMVFDPLLPDEWIDTQARHRFFSTLMQFDEAGRDIWQHLYQAATGKVSHRKAPASLQH